MGLCSGVTTETRQWISTKQTKQFIAVVFRSKHTVYTPLSLHGNTVQSVRSTRSLGGVYNRWFQMLHWHHLPCQKGTPTYTPPVIDEESKRIPSLLLSTMDSVISDTFHPCRNCSSLVPFQQSSTHPSHGLSLPPLDSDYAAYSARLKQTNKKKDHQFCLPLNWCTITHTPIKWPLDLI